MKHDRLDSIRLWNLREGTRLSFYFAEGVRDSHHIQFAPNVTRERIANQLSKLAESIRRGDR